MQLKSVVKGPVLGVALVTVAGLMLLMPCRHSCGAQRRQAHAAVVASTSVTAQGGIRVETVPPGATITLDGRVLEATTPATIAAGPGTHLVGLSREGFRDLMVVAGTDDTRVTTVQRNLPPFFVDQH